MRLVGLKVDERWHSSILLMISGNRRFIGEVQGRFTVQIDDSKPSIDWSTVVEGTLD